MKKLVGYRVYRAFLDNEGKVFHKRPVGFAKTIQGARALCVSGSGIGGTMVIEEVYEQ